MRRKIVLFIIIAICFLLQTTVFRALTFANIGPNLLIIVVSSFGCLLPRRRHTRWHNRHHQSLLPCPCQPLQVLHLIISFYK